MKQRLLFLLTLILSWVPFASQAQRFVKKNTTANTKSLLWRITGNGLKDTSYVMGTIHLICKDDYFFTPAMDSAIHQVDNLVLEMDISDPRMLTSFQDSMKLPAGQRLRDFFHSEEEYTQFKMDMNKAVGMDISPLEGHKPFLLLSMLTTSAFSCKEQASYETKLSGMANYRGMHVIGLETFDEQLRVFDGLNKEAMRGLLLESLKESKQTDKTMNKMVGLYKKQDLDGLYKLMSESADMKSSQDALLFDRNKRWAERLPDIMNKSSVFIAVGAAHLPGQAGVLNLLREKGYTVEAVK